MSQATVHLVHAARSVSALFVLSAFCVLAAAQVPMRYSGSDTVEPVVEAASVAFARGHAGFKLQIQSTGTSVGLRDLCAGRTVLAGASRPMKPEEAKVCATANIQFSEIPVAMDAVGLVVSSKNTWLKDLTLAEAASLFDPASTGKLTSWKQVRPTFPDLPIRPAGVNVKHGTFSFFADSMGLKGFLRSDYKDFGSHAETGQYVAKDPGAIGFMSTAEVQSMKDQIRLVPLDFGAGPVMPGATEVMGGKYDKLSRTIFLYVNLAALAKNNPQDIEFTKFLVNDLEKFARFANLIPLRALQYQENLKRVSFTR